MQSRPLNLMFAIGTALLPLPAMKLVDHVNRGCGDGLCGFFSGLLILGGLAIATVVFIVRSARRQEAPAILRVVPFVLWTAALVPLFL